MLHESYRITATVLASMCCVLLCLSGTQASAQTQTTQFNLSQVEKQPGKILVSPGYTTLIDFPAAVDRSLTGDGSIFKYRNFGSQVALSANKSAGQTDLVVTSGGRVALFVVQVDSLGKAPRRYTVTDTPAQPARVTTPRAAAVAVQAPVKPVAANGLRPADLLAKYEAERAVLYGAAITPDARASGGLLVQNIDRPNRQVSFPTVRAPSSGTYTLRIRYGNGTTSPATQSLTVNTVGVSEVQYPPLGGPDRYATVDVPVTLRAGTNTVRLSAGQGAATLDVLELWGLRTGEAAALPAALGGAASGEPAPPTSAPAPDKRVQIPLTNPGFEQGFSDWKSWWDKSLSDSSSVSNKLTHSGTGAGSLSNNRPYTQNIYKLVKNLPNGKYTYEIWVKTNGGQEQVTLFANNAGGPAVYTVVPVKSETGWTKYSIRNFSVTNNQVEIGVFTSSLGGTHWVLMDDMALFRESAPSAAAPVRTQPAPPASPPTATQRTPLPASRPLNTSSRNTGDSVWVAQAGTGTVLAYDGLQTLNARSPASRSMAQGSLRQPYAVAVDRGGNQYVAENVGLPGSKGQGRVLRYRSGGASMSRGGETASIGGLDFPTALALDGQNRLWVVQSGLNSSGKPEGTPRVSRFDPNTLKETTGFALTPNLGFPSQAAIQGNTLWLTTSFGLLLRYDVTANPALNGIYTLNGQLNAFGGVAAAGASLWLSGKNSGAGSVSSRVVRLNPAALPAGNASSGVDGSAAVTLTLSSGLYDPAGLDQDAQGNLWVVNKTGAAGMAGSNADDHGTLVRFSAAGLASASPAPNLSLDLGSRYPVGLAVGKP